MEAAWVPEESREMLSWLCGLCRFTGTPMLKAHQTEDSTCTRPHVIILQQGHAMVKGEKGKAEEEDPRRSTTRVDTVMEESSFVTQGAGFSQGWLPMAE